MKKLISFVLSFFVIISLSACGKQSNPPAETKTNPDVSSNKDIENKATTPDIETTDKYKDGTYEGIGDKWEHGQESAIVTIENGKIVKVDLKRLDTNGKEVNYEQWTGQKDASGKVYPNLKQYRIDLANKIIEKQSPDVDVISGATISSKNWKTAVERALDKAKL
ncbi:FMN-binding protein [Clostridium prolinivorans]|uniref:FMN-binding protein n=1 Tax=Clostridium prolinivorans TaxID=2769420 RepID=UPI000FDC8EA2|nr:FMN-binding protein [Clostridium prolinivorans]